MDYSKMAISVSELNKYIKNKINNDEYLKSVLIKGEISNFKNHYTGHMYFTLKDENSLIKCIMFKTYAQKLNFVPKDGMTVVILGNVSVFERDGIYQIYAEAMIDDGIGNLYAEFEKLKQELEQKGMFDESIKKKIPIMPKVIGVLTSETGSVIRDIINVSTRRNPNVHIKLFPVPVQGNGAAEKISEAIKIMNENNLADVIIIARGGGSIEDLWPFNERIVAESIYKSKLPIISAIGHETDFTIADFVADLRAPTPSAAAEIAVADIFEMKNKIESYTNRYKQALNKKVQIMKLRYEKCMKSSGWTEINRNINKNYIIIDGYLKQLDNLLKIRIGKEKSKYIELISKLDTLSPLKILSRGYTITEKDGNIIKSKKALKNDDIIKLKFVDGECIAKIQ